LDCLPDVSFAKRDWDIVPALTNTKKVCRLITKNMRKLKFLIFGCETEDFTEQNAKLKVEVIES